MKRTVDVLNGAILTLDSGSIANTALKDVIMKVGSGLFILH
jgi:hypothetical protein